MEYLQLLDRLQKSGYQYHIYGNKQLNPELFHVRILTDSQHARTASTLYLAPAQLLPDPGISQPVIIFSAGQHTDTQAEAYADSQFQIVFFNTEITEGAFLNLLLDCLTEIQQISAGMHLLVNALFSGNGLQYLVDTASGLFGNPIYVIDLQHKYLAISAGIVPDNIFFQEEHSAGYISTAGIQYILKHRLDEKIRQCSNALYHYNELVEKSMLIDVIEIQGIEVGHVMMLECEQTFRDFEQEFFHRFSKLISMELQKDTTFKRNKGVMYSYFLADLIRHPAKNTQDIRKRLKTMGYQLKETFYIIAIPSLGYSSSDLKVEVILERLRYILSGNIYVIYENTIVFLLSRDMNQHLSGYEMQQLETYLLANDLKAGVSNFFQNLEDTPRFYEQAVSSVLLGLKLNAPASIYYYKDYYLYQMLESYEKENSKIRYLIQPGLMKLYLYDKEHGTDFINTMTEFLKHPGQPSTIAQNLHIHKNTLLYRMGKVKQITGCEFLEGEEYMNYNLSMMIMKYLHMI